MPNRIGACGEGPDAALTVRDRLGLALCAALVLLPFLYPRHTPPIPTFYAEWWAVALGLALVAAILLRREAWAPLRIPGVIAVPAVFCVFAVLQLALRQVAFVEQGLLYASLLVWAALLMLAGRHLRDRCGLDRLAETVAAAVLAAALANALFAILQWQGADRIARPWVFPLLPGYAPYGNLAQANHLNAFLWLGIASALFLHLHARLAPALMWPAVALLVFAAALTASRSIFLYATVLPALGLLPALRAPTGPGRRRWLILSLPLLPLAAAAQAVLHMAPLIAGNSAGGGTQTAALRVFADVGGIDIRLRLMAGAWQMFLAAPWFGHGIGSVPHGLFVAGETLGAASPGVAEHVHNIVFQLLAEFGLLPCLLAAAAAGLWLRSAVAAPVTAARLWLLALLAIVAIHSLLEYPLWHAHFLALAALLLGAGDGRVNERDVGIRGAVAAGLVVVAGAVPLATLHRDYAQLETALAAARLGAPWEQVAPPLVSLHERSLLAPYALWAVADAMTPESGRLDAKASVCRSALRFAPTFELGMKCAGILRLAEREQEADRLLLRAERAFPQAAAALAAALRETGPPAARATDQ